MGFVVLFIRCVAFVFANHITISQQVKDILDLLTPAILTVIIATGVLFERDAATLSISIGNNYLMASIFTLLISIYIRNLFAVIALGFLIFSLLSSIPLYWI